MSMSKSESNLCGSERWGIGKENIWNISVGFAFSALASCHFSQKTRGGEKVILRANNIILRSTDTRRLALAEISQTGPHT